MRYYTYTLLLVRVMVLSMNMYVHVITLTPGLGTRITDVSGHREFLLRGPQAYKVRGLSIS